MKKAKRGNFIILMFVIAIVVFASIYVDLYNKSKQGGFNNSKKTAAEILYDEIINYDLLNEYPKTPSEVVEIYCKTVRFLYGNMTADQELMYNVINVQRALLDDEILNLTGIEKQLDAFLLNLEKLKELNVICVGFEQKPPIYDEKDTKSCIINVTQLNSGASNSVKDYYLSKNNDSNQWKITKWEIVSQQTNGTP